MQRLLSVILMSVLLTGILTSHAQDDLPQDILYSVAFSLENGNVGTATYLSDGNWRFGAPRGRILFGEVDAQLVQPQWTADGRQLLMTLYEPRNDEVATRVQRFDIVSQQSDIVMETYDPELRGLVPEFVRLASLAPDGRYAWAYRMRADQYQLLDLANARIIQTGGTCSADVLAWDAEAVVLSCDGRGFAEPDIFTLSLADGTRRATLLPPPPDNANPMAGYVSQAQHLPDGALLVGAFASDIPRYTGVVARDAYDGVYFDIGQGLQANPQGDQAAQISAGTLQRLNLATGTADNLGAATLSDSAFWHEGGLRFWQTATRPDGQFEITRVEASPLRRMERVRYRGPAPQGVRFAPDGDDIIALEFRPSANEAYVELYQAGELVWVSDFILPGSYTTLQAPRFWSGDWLHLDFRPSLQDPLQTLSLNVQTLAMSPAPSPRARLVSIAPDGAWWLYTLAPPSDPDRPTRLIAYDPLTQRIVPFVEDAPLYTSTILPAYTNYVWSIHQAAR